MDYQSALKYLYGLTDYEKERIARYDPDTLDLSRVERVLSRLGSPHKHFPSVHIAGTKGKGSVATICASVLQAGGLRAGLYTSPHLHTFRERIRVNGELISPDALIALLQECRSVFDTEPELTTFEAITALTFAYFAQQQVDFAVVEVGLGGRLDATNVITPQVVIITSLSFDHTYLLGDTLAEIAREKAGIIKPGVPTVCAPQKAEALNVIEEICTERRSPLTLIGRDWTWQLLPSESRLAAPGMEDPWLGGQSFDLRHAQNLSHLEGAYTLPLLGRHQLNNAAAAIAAIDLLQPAGVQLHPHNIRQGLANVRWPGRFEVLEPDMPLVVDCAHNSDSVTKLVAALDNWFPCRQWTFIVGISSDKDVSGMLQVLAPRTHRLLATQSQHPRAMPPEEIAEMAAEILPGAGAPAAEIMVTSNVAAALDLALGRDDHEHYPSCPPLPREKPGMAAHLSPICVTGSIFAVADAREAWASYRGSALPETDCPITHELLPLSHSPAAQTQILTH